jgi:hypothetical protein
VKFERLTREGGGPPLGTFFGGVLIFGAGLAALWLWLALPRPVCTFRIVTGIPCPTCGSTRLAEKLFAGDLWGALAASPLVAAALTAVALWGLWSTIAWLAGWPPRRVILEARERLALRILAVLVLAAGWAYLIWRGA